MKKLQILKSISARWMASSNFYTLRDAALEGRITLVGNVAQGIVCAGDPTTKSRAWDSMSKCRSVTLYIGDDAPQVGVEVYHNDSFGQPTSFHWSATFRIEDLTLLDAFESDISQAWAEHLEWLYHKEQERLRKERIREIEASLLEDS